MSRIGPQNAKSAYPRNPGWAKIASRQSSSRLFPYNVIEVHHSVDRDNPTVIEVRSNLSMTLDRLAAVFLGLSAVVLLVALGPTIMGYWPIMLAAIVHLIMVGWCLRLAWRGNWARERILIGPEQVVVEHFDLHRQSRSYWPAAWLQVNVEQGQLGERRISLSCQGRRQMVGLFLPPQERLVLADTLKDSLRPYSAWSDKKQLQVSRG